MQQFKIYILSTLFAIGLLISPTVSFEERVDVALKFESGLLIKNKVIFGSSDSFISAAKSNSRSNLELILSERRQGISKLDNPTFADQLSLSVVNNAFDSAILPTMNNMLTMGIVSLPGMMTGQILSGTFPLTAIKYQIGIMLAILGSTGLATVLFVTLGYRTFFTKDNRLK